MGEGGDKFLSGSTRTLFPTVDDVGQRSQNVQMVLQAYVGQYSLIFHTVGWFPLLDQFMAAVLIQFHSMFGKRFFFAPDLHQHSAKEWSGRQLERRWSRLYVGKERIRLATL